MSEFYEWILYVVVFFIGIFATLAYWVARYYFKTDDEEAQLKWTSKKEKKNK